MAIVQISKIQQRSGNLVDLPQLDDAEFGWATDSKSLFIGKSSPNENIEVLTSYSNISFSQVVGSFGNLNISNATSANGQVLTFDGTNWVNRGGSAGGLISLGDVANVRIDGAGGIGYVLQTDGQGNLSWTPKTTVRTTIIGLSAATPIVMTVDANTPYTNATQVTISGATGAGNSIVNGSSFYVKVATNFPTTGNVSLYSDASLTVAVAGTGIVYTANSGIAVSAISGSGSGGAGGANTSIQYNNGGVITGSANITFDFANNLLTVNGNANVGNLNATGVVTATRLISNIATGTAPLSVTSTTVVPNLYVARANVSDYGVVTTQTTGTFYPVLASGSTTANYAHASNANLSFNAATGALSATLLTGTITTAAQPNITSVGTLTSLGVNGTTTGVAFTANTGVFTGNGNGLSSLQGANFTGTINSTVLGNSTHYIGTTSIALNRSSLAQSLTGITSIDGYAATVSSATQSNITSVGTLTSLGVNGTTTGVAFTANTGVFTGNGNGLSSLQGANFTGTINSTVLGNSTLYLGTTDIALNRSSLAQSLTGITSIDGYAATVSTAAQPNITSVGTLTSLGVNGTTTGVAFTANTGVFTGNGSGLSAIVGANVSGTVANATYSVSAGTSGTVTIAAQPNITSVGTLSSLTTTIITTGANTTAGTITGNWGLSAGSKLTATYADLAEYYSADAEYAPGTVLAFGGEQEVTLAVDATNKVAGVVSTNPAYVMNSTCKGEFIVALALQGRVPCKVRGIIHKGDMLISGGDGYARPSNSPLMGTVIGKALEHFDGIEGIIEVAVGRL
jgi:hypothetical protein